MTMSDMENNISHSLNKGCIYWKKDCEAKYILAEFLASLKVLLQGT